MLLEMKHGRRHDFSDGAASSVNSDVTPLSQFKGGGVKHLLEH